MTAPACVSADLHTRTLRRAGVAAGIQMRRLARASELIIRSGFQGETMPHSAYASPQALLVWHELNQTTVRPELVEGCLNSSASTDSARTAFAQRTAHSAQRTAHSAQRTAHSAQRTAHSAQRTAHSIRRGRPPARVPAFPKFLHRRIPCARYFCVPVFYRFI